MRLLRYGVIGVALTGVVLAVLASALIGSNALGADRVPGTLETAVARRLVVLSLPASERRAPNPLASQPGAWRAGATHFDEHCAMCHGSDGRGHSAIGPRMSPPVPDLAGAAVQELSDGALFAIIQHGVRWTGMPAFRSSHSAEDTWALVAFIRRLPHASAGDLDVAHGDAPEVSGAVVEVTIDGTRFEPREVTIAVGDTLVWVNKDPFPHNVSSSAGGFHSGDLPPDRHWRFRPNSRGTFPYVCTLHPGMSGVVHVE